MFLRWKKAYLVMALMCNWKEGVELGFRMTPKLWSSCPHGDGGLHLSGAAPWGPQPRTLS